MHRLILAASLALALPAMAQAHGVEIRDPYAISANPRTGAAFMVIDNRGHADRIVGARAPVSDRIELHTHVMENGVAKMIEVEGGIVLPEKSVVTLERGGLHVMFMGLRAPLKEGETFPLTLVLEEGGEITVEVPVRSLRAAPAPHAHHAAPAPHASAPAMHHAGGDEVAIAATMKAHWETGGAPLTVDPVVVSGDHAIASWRQDGKGGRALLSRDGHHGWTVALCSGESLRKAANLEAFGVPAEAASALAAALAAAEAKLDPAAVALFDSFEGTVLMGEHGHHAKP